MSAEEDVERGPGRSDDTAEHGLRDRLSSAGEDALGELAQSLFENPVFNQAVAAALGAGERAIQAQRSAMTALNIPSSSEIERLERRLRSVSDRVEVLEDRLDEVADELNALRGKVAGAPTVSSDQARLGIPDSRGGA